VLQYLVIYPSLKSSAYIFASMYNTDQVSNTTSCSSVCQSWFDR